MGGKATCLSISLENASAMYLRPLVIIAALLIAPSFALAVDHRVEKLDEAAPADAVSVEIAARLESTGAKVVRGTSRSVCSIWLCKELETTAEATAGGGIQYPFQQGQLIGVIQYPRKGSDFRDQDIAEGVYTLRYGLQPVDGAHVGTFPTRDFLLLSKAEVDQSAAPVDIKTLNERSAEAAETNHPAFLALLKVEGKAEAFPAIAENEENEWWIVRLEAQTKSGGKAAKLPLDIVVAGHAAE